MIERLGETLSIWTFSDVDHGGGRGTQMRKARGRLPKATLEFRQAYSPGLRLVGKAISDTIFCGFYGIETLLTLHVPFL